MAWTRAVSANTEAVDALADEAQAIDERASERSERAEVRKRLLEGHRGGAVECAACRGMALNECQRGLDQLLEIDQSICSGFWNRREDLCDPAEQLIDLVGLGDHRATFIICDLLSRGVCAIALGETAEREFVRVASPCGFCLG